MFIADPEAVARLTELALPLLEETRDQAPAATRLAPGQSEQQRELAEECQAVLLAIQAVLNASRLQDAATMICLGGVAGTILAQCTSSHSETSRLFYNQFRESYTEAMRDLTPAGSMN